MSSAKLLDLGRLECGKTRRQGFPGHWLQLVHCTYLLGYFEWRSQIKVSGKVLEQRNVPEGFQV